MSFTLDEYRRLLVAALGNATGRAFLAVLVERINAQPSYQPGDPFDAVAWREGRKDLARQLLRDLETALQPQPLEQPQ